MSNNVLPFSKISKKDVSLAGGKGASLGEMIQAKIPVPSGFVILASSFNKFLMNNDLEQKIDKFLLGINYQKLDSIDRISRKIRKLILETNIDNDLQKEIKREFKKLNSKYVAVRSSATAEDSSSASWAGELETYLNTTSSTLLINIKKCWSSLFTPRAMFYRYEKKMLKKKVSVAVVVQKMIQSEVSGIAFTVHPVTKNKNEMIIEAGYGLGEAIVSGSITPDSYILQKNKLLISEINIGDQNRKIVRSSIRGNTKWVVVNKIKQNKQKLSNKNILKLARICLNIEKHYKFPCDIEWAFEKNKFYITQSRPITTL